jgi:hypothetical protein
LVNGFRKGVDADVVEELEERVVGARVLEWWEAMGWEQEGSRQEVVWCVKMECISPKK